MSGLWISLLQFSQTAASGGAISALAAVCLLYYLHHIYLLDGTRELMKSLREELSLVELECRQLGRERSVTRTEIQLLREMLGQPDFEKTSELLLRRFIPNVQEGLAAVIQLGPSADLRVMPRGLSEESVRNLQLDPEFVASLRNGPPILIDGSRLTSTRLMASLSVADRRKIESLALVGVGAGDQMHAILMTSRLLPVCGVQRQQLELLARIAASLSGSLHQYIRHHHQSAQLQFTQVLLELRGVLDALQADPIRVMQAFLERVVQLVEADRGVVFLISDRHGSGLAPAARIGQPLSAGAEPVWRRHEEAIARAGFKGQQQSSFDSTQLKRFHVDSLIGSALTIPIIIDDRTPGVLCLTRSRNAPFAAHLQSLLENAVDVFTTVMNRGLEAQEFERQAREDGLTELANRREFDRQLLREVEAVHAQQVDGCCLLLLDLDRFKKVNDDYGHQGGDEVLRITARILKDRVARIRSGDRVLLARYGGEEMALILPSFTMQGALRVAEQVREAIETTDFRYENRSIHVTVSIGVASCPLHALNAPDLLEAADTALYQAKTRGRNRVCAAIQSPLVESGSGILG